MNIYEMDMRQLDPAIGRWVVQDPVVHHDYSPYSAFDNNPVYWSDPSGADATSLINSLWNRSGSGLTSYTLEDGEVIDVQYDTAESLQSMYELTANTGDTGGGGGDGKKDTRTKAQKEADTRAHLQAMLKINKSLLDIRILMTPIEELQALYISLKALTKNGAKNVGDLYAKVEIYLTKTLASKKNPSLLSQETKLLPQAYSRFSRFETHYTKHYKEWGAAGKDAYYNRALSLMESKVSDNILGFTNEAGYTFRMNVRTGEFGVMRADGVIETFFRRVNNPMGYWNTQIMKYGK